MGAVLALAGCGCASPTPGEPPVARIIAEEVAYARDRSLDVFAPVPVPDDPVAIVILLHACCGDRADLTKLAETITAEGVVVLNVGWGGFDADGSYPESYEDVACAVRFARAEGESYGADPQRVALVGWSDGALAGAVVAHAGDSFAVERCSAQEHSALPDTFVGVNGFYGWTAPIDISYITDRAVGFFDGAPAEQPQAWSDATPYSWLGRRLTMPSVLLVGATDPLRADAERFDAALRAAGQPSRLLILPPAGDQSLISARTEEGRVVARETAAAARRSAESSGDPLRRVDTQRLGRGSQEPRCVSAASSPSPVSTACRPFEGSAVVILDGR
jgi:acetyl esterase/lipase